MSAAKRRVIRDLVIERDGKKCFYCKKNLKPSEITLDHIVPRSEGGSFHSTNLVVCCNNCNNKRGNIYFFDFCKQFNLPKDKLNILKKIYLNTLKIKALSIAYNNCVLDFEIPSRLINIACDSLKIKTPSFPKYKGRLNFFVENEKSLIINCFKRLITILHNHSNELFDLTKNR